MRVPPWPAEPGFGGIGLRSGQEGSREEKKARSPLFGTQFRPVLHETLADAAKGPGQHPSALQDRLGLVGSEIGCVADARGSFRVECSDARAELPCREAMNQVHSNPLAGSQRAAPAAE